MMSSVLVANRGEIAVRIFRTLADLGIRRVAVYSDADAGSRHVHAADTAVRIGPAPAARSYLDADAVLEAAAASGAEAIHPGYGFLSENASFARAVIDAGLTWIGPPPAAIDTMGDKIEAKRTVAAAGVPVVPGRGAPGLDDEALAAAAMEVGLPVLLKPSAGGGGKGMRLVEAEADLAGAIASARREARGAFGDDTLLVERWIARPRHIEVQVLGDQHGHVVHLGERECSLQRRHQKIVEEAPSPLLNDATRARLGASAVDAAVACGYVGAGTVELIVSADRPDEYFFMEMNTRLQVEHPVTEATWGLDLVAWQVRVASGERLPWVQTDLAPRGHAVEARVYAEDPGRGFLPASGRVLVYREPAGDGVRVDSSLLEGSVVGTDYDPMLAKVVAWGPDRAQALARLAGALGETVVLGLTTNTDFLRRLVSHPEVIAGRIDTGLVERLLSELTDAPDGGVGGVGGVGRQEAAVAAAMAWALDAEPDPLTDPWDVPGGWRVGGPAATRLSLNLDGQEAVVGVTGRAAASTVAVDGGRARTVSATRAGAGGPGGHEQAPAEMTVTTGGVGRRWWGAIEPGSGDRWVGTGGASWRVRHHVIDAVAAAAAVSGGPVTSPMPGTVLAVSVSEGDEVVAGAALVVVEAMKMEHTVASPVDGTVREVRVRAGQAVALDEVLAVVVDGSPSASDRPG